jgi:hypothetical protein
MNLKRAKRKNVIRAKFKVEVLHQIIFCKTFSRKLLTVRSLPNSANRLTYAGFNSANAGPSPDAKRGGKPKWKL